MSPKKSEISESEVEKYLKRLRDYSNSAKYDLAYNPAVKLKREHPQILKFAYYEAVMTAENTVGLSPAEANRRFKLASQKFRHLLKRMNGLDPNTRYGIRNEYYWFSKQPDKAFKKACDIAGKPYGWKAVKDYRKEILEVVKTACTNKSALLLKRNTSI